MYSDKSLLPREAIRLAALGAVSEAPMRYGDLAGAVRHFASRIVGPSLELMGSSIALLRAEGLVEPTEPGEDPPLAITGAGRRELAELLRASVRGPSTEVGRLVFALKMRYLHLLEPDERRVQVEMMIEAAEAEIARLADLERSGAPAPGFFAEWLGHDLALARERRRWLEAFRGSV